MDTSKLFNKAVVKCISEQALETIDVFFSSTPDPTEVFSSKTLGVLMKMLKTNAKHQDKSIHVNCVLSCLQHFCNSDIDSCTWEQLAEEVSKLCELVFVITDMFIKDEHLVERTLNVLSTIIEMSGSSLTHHLLRYLVEYLLKTFLSKSYTFNTRVLVLDVVGSLLVKSSRQIRSEIIPSIATYLEDLSNHLLVCGDYETQVSVLEVLARSWNYFKENDPVPVLFSDFPRVQHLFTSYQFVNFDPECRLFLNQVNSELRDKQVVFSVPCMVVSVDDVRLKKPNDASYKEFWVDFNLGSRSLSFYYMLSATEPWEVMKINGDCVISAVAKNSSCKSKEGEVIEAVKIEMSLKPDTTKPMWPTLLKIYPRKTDEFEQIEKVAIKEVLQDKYQSEVTYNVVPTRVQAPTKSNKTEVAKAESFIETTMLPPQLSDDSEEDEIVNPSPDCQVSVSRSRGDSAGESLQNTDVGLRGSDSFSNYIKVLKDLQKERETTVVENTSEDIVGGSGAITDNEEEDRESGTRGRNVTKLKTIETQPDSASTSKLLNSEPIDLDKNHIEQPPGSRDASCKSRKRQKRRLYSGEDSNAQDLVFSSQGEFSVEVPEYKLIKTETVTKPQPNLIKNNISYSYVSSNEKKKKTINTNNDGIFSDSNYCEERLTMKETKNNNPVKKVDGFNNFKFFKDSEAKLLALNKTPDEAKKSKLFTSHSVYSDFSSTEKETQIRKTYARPKPKVAKRGRVKPVVHSSDSDSDFTPPNKMTPMSPPVTRLGRKTRSIVDGKGFVSELPKTKVDPIRGQVYTNCTYIAPLGLEEPEMKKKDLDDILVLEAKDSKKGCKIKKGKLVSDNKKTTSKKPVKKNKKVDSIQTKTYRGKKDEVEEKLSENMEEESHMSMMEIVNYEPSEDVLDSDNFSLDVLSSQPSQNQAIVRRNFNTNNNMNTCLMRFKNNLSKSYSLAQKERAMNFATFDFESQASCAIIHKQCEKMHVVSKNLTKMKSFLNLMDSTYNMQMDIAAQIETEAIKLEEAKKTLVKNVTKIDKTETSQATSALQEFCRSMKNGFLSLVQKMSSRNDQ